VSYSKKKKGLIMDGSKKTSRNHDGLTDHNWDSNKKFEMQMLKRLQASKKTQLWSQAKVTKQEI
jgi:hypothetical protein